MIPVAFVFTFIYFVCGFMLVYVGLHVAQNTVEVRRQLMGVNFLWVSALNSHPQAWLQAPLPTEPSSWAVALRLLVLSQPGQAHLVLGAAISNQNHPQSMAC